MEPTLDEALSALFGTSPEGNPRNRANERHARTCQKQRWIKPGPTCGSTESNQFAQRPAGCAGSIDGAHEADLPMREQTKRRRTIAR